MNSRKEIPLKERMGGGGGEWGRGTGCRGRHFWDGQEEPGLVRGGWFRRSRCTTRRREGGDLRVSTSDSYDTFTCVVYELLVNDTWSGT